jgi:hypothetical protein
MHASKAQHTERPEHNIIGELLCAASFHVVPSAEEVPDATVDVVIDGPVCLQASAVAEVRRPTQQQPIQSVTHIWPRPFVAGNQDVANLCLDPQQ